MTDTDPWGRPLPEDRKRPASRVEGPVQRVRIGGRYDDRDVPYVRLTRTVQSGFGLGVGIALAQLVAVLLGLIIFGAMTGAGLSP